MDKKEIIKKLTDDGYDNRMAYMVASELILVDGALIPFLIKWMNGEEENFEVEGYSIRDLMHSRNMTYPAALLTLDWLVKDPQKAIESLKRGRR